MGHPADSVAIITKFKKLSLERTQDTGPQTQSYKTVHGTRVTACMNQGKGADEDAMSYMTAVEVEVEEAVMFDNDETDMLF